MISNKPKIRSVKYKGSFSMFLVVTVTVFFFSCNGDNVPDCFQNSGDIIRQEVSLADFNTITVFENLNLIVKQGDVQRVEIESGEFLINDVSAVVEGNRLVLRNDNNCNFVRDFGLTTVYVTSPNITELRSSTGLLISSDGVLNYPTLTLLSESFGEPEADTTDGAFNLQVNSENINITSNGIAFFQLSGTTENLNITIAAGDSRIETDNLVSQNVSINQRGTNDVFINPQQRINGIIRGLGDVISSNRPPEVEVEEIFNGRLIFRD